MKILSRKSALLYILSVLQLFFFGCDKKDTPVDPGSDPSIAEIRISPKWNILADQKYKVEVSVNDPQGFADIAGTVLQVFKKGSSQLAFFDSLHDDGAYFFPQDGDVVAGDGVYSDRYTVPQIDPNRDVAEYTFRFFAIDKSGNESITAETEVVFARNAAPVITSITAPDSLKSGQTQALFQIIFADSDGVDDVIEAYFDSEEFGGTTPFFNDGDIANHGDAFADDSIFSSKLDSTFGAAKKGVYELRFHVKDSFNEFNENIPVHFIFVENSAGRILHTTVPDTVIRPSQMGITETFVVLAEATDPQGLADIDSVYFISQASDDSFITDAFGKVIKILLKDNGIVDIWGDTTADDGIFSRIIAVENSNTPDQYRFHFFVRDILGNLSTAKIDTIIIE